MLRTLLFAITCTYLPQIFAQAIPISVNGKYIFVNQYQKKAFEGSYIEAGFFHNKLAAVRQNGSFFYINEKGEQAFEGSYDCAFDFDGNFALVGLLGEYHVISNTGKMLAGPFDTPFLPKLSANYIVCPSELNDTFIGLKDIHNKWVLNPKFQEIHFSKNGYVLCVDDSSKAHLFHPNLSLITQEFEDIEVISERDGEWLILQGKSNDEKSWLLISEYGNTLFKKAYEGENLRHSRPIGNKYIYLPKEASSSQYSSFLRTDAIYNRAGNQLFLNTPFLLDSNFSDLQWAQLQNKVFPLDNNGNIRGYEMYDEVLPQSITGSVALVKKEGTWSIYGRQNQQGYRNIHKSSLGKAIFFFQEEQSNKPLWGCVNFAGQVQITPKFTKIDNEWNQGLIKAYTSDSTFYLSERGAVVWAGIPTKHMVADNISTLYNLNTRSNASSPQKEIPKKVKALRKKKDPFSLIITPYAYNTKNYLSRDIYLINNLKQAQVFNVQDGRVEILLQAFINGEWKAISVFMNSWCGNSYYFKNIEANHFYRFTFPNFKGTISTEVRAVFIHQVNDQKVQYISNSVSMSINPGQLWVDPWSSF